ncbi:MAG: uridine diphosphate-N-acetylglucosamine-binding protein YvcK [Candidatus Omnitrophota bacterium]
MKKPTKRKTETVLLIGAAEFTDKIQPVLSHLRFKYDTASAYPEITRKIQARNTGIVIFDDSVCSSGIIRKKTLKTLYSCKKIYIYVSSIKNISHMEEVKDLGATDYMIKPFSIHEFALRFSACAEEKTRVSCIGGGTGLFNLLMGLKTLPGVLPVSIVSTADDGGSSGRLKSSFGILPPGDIRRSLVALSSAPELMNRVIRYRFKKGGDLRGHSFGNLFLTVLSEICGSMPKAIRGLSDILRIRGIVFPVADTKTTLNAMFEDGSIIKGESNIDLGKGRDINLRVKKCWHEPPLRCDARAYASILNSEIITIGPGDLFTSVITNLLIKDIREAILKTTAKKIYICNLMTKPGETPGYTAADHLREIVKYLGRDCLDYVIVSDTLPASAAKTRYSRKKQFQVKAGKISLLKKLTGAKIIIADVGHKNDLIHHNSVRLRNTIKKIIDENPKNNKRGKT